jgi:hypothetical protein
MSYYVVKNKYSIPGFIFVGVASWAIVLALVTAVLGIFWIIEVTAHIDLLAALPKSLVLFLDFCGAYAAIGSFCLWMTMWIYWIAIERSSVFVRIGWLLALLFGLVYGALFYAFIVWKNDIFKVKGQQSLRDVSV